ncbi:GAF domain-containing sensor histidine kinase [Streptomyces sp. NRRL F-5755]|uniref:GAF domain-containing sensor histidine kinase n=1 Tax=Streptomyces sp. NRRL F-5755 TaxID=1519475 RepID=UPI001331B8D0|nr:ATP-binding protein [Streptomyces sp. NRRL F-5755]
MRYSRGDWPSSGLGVAEWFPNAGPVEDGDVAVAINGYPLADGVGSVPARLIGQGAVLRYRLLRDGAPIEVDLLLVRPDLGLTLVLLAGPLLYLAVFGLLASWLRARRPTAPTQGPLFLAFTASFAWLVAGPVVGLTALDAATGSLLFWLYHVATLVGGTLAWSAMVDLALVLLRGRWPDRRHRRLRIAAYATPLLLLTEWIAALLWLGPGGMRTVGLVHVGQEVIIAACWLTAGWLSLLLYRHATAARRRPLRWVLGGGLLTGLALFALWLVPDIAVGRRPTSMLWLGLAGLPVLIGITVAILRYDVYAIKQVVSRSIEYATLAAVLYGCYLAVAAAAAAAAASDTLVAASAAVAVAVVALPLREGIRRHASRRLFGGREDPARALRALGRTLARVPSPQQALPQVAAGVIEALRLPHVAVEIADPTAPDGFRTTQNLGAPIGETYRLPLRHHGRTVGRLTVCTREADEPLSPADHELLSEVAGQLGAAVHAVVSYEDVSRSRAAAVATREHERRRLRRDLHDTLSPTLIGLSMKIDAALVLLGDGLPASPPPPPGEHAGHPVPSPAPPADARRLLAESAAGIREAAVDLRRLVEGLRPPALDALGLTDAVRAAARELVTHAADGPRLEVAGPAKEAKLPAGVEVAAYHIAVEAVTNCVRHAHASHCTVRLRLTHHGAGHHDGPSPLLSVEVRDDGTGVPDPPGASPGAPGAGLPSMRERAEELGGTCSVRPLPGGGTVVHALLPCPSAGRPAPGALSSP